MRPFVFLIVGLLAALITMAPASAQDTKPDDRPRMGSGSGNEKGRPGIRMGGADEGTEDPAAPAPPPIPERSEPEQLVEVLSTWPTQAARRAAVILAAQPTVAYPLLEAKMMEPDLPWRTIAGVVAALGQVGNVNALELIEAKLQDRRMYQHSGDLFDAILRLDPVGGKSRLRAALMHPAGAVVEQAAKRLETRVSQPDADSLRDVYEAGGDAARAAAVRLLAKADPEGSRADVVKALRDQSPPVCLAAARALGRENSKEVLDLLRGATTAPVDRQLAYACLGLAFRGRRTGEMLVDQPLGRTLLGGRGVKSLERLNRATAAILLADVGYFHDVARIDEVLESVVTPALIEAWVAADYWKDTKQVRPLVLLRLQRLTGQFDLERPADWVSWWDRNRDEFRARRVLTRVQPEQTANLRVSVTGAGAPGDETTILAGRSDYLTASIRGEVPILLVPDDLAALAQAVNDSGILEVREGFTGSQLGGGPLSITVKAGNRERRTGHRPDLLTQGAEALMLKIEELRTRYRWQRYRPARAGIDLQAFVESMAPAFSIERTQSERDGSLVRLIVRALDPVDPDRSIRAMKELATIPGLSEHMQDEDVDRLLRIMGSQETFTPLAESILRVLSVSGKPEAHPLLLDFLATRPAARTHELTVEVLRSATHLQLADALKAERSRVRIAALDALAPDLLKGAEVAAARAALQDDTPTVREAAVRALGRLRAEDLRGELETMAGKDGELRVAAVEALGMLGGKASLPVIMQAYADRDPTLRVAAVQAFASAGDAGEPEGLSAIVFAMSGDPSPLVREVAARSIKRLGTDRAAAALRQLAIDPGQPDGPRATAVKSLAALRGTRATADLSRLLGDASEEVADAAAVALGQWRSGDGVPRLIAMLEAGRRSVQAR